MLLQIHAPAALFAAVARGMAGRQRPAHLLQLRAGRHLLGEQRGLDAVEQPLQPADQLGLGDPQLGVARRRVLAERQRDPLQLLDQLRGQALLELLDRGRVDLRSRCRLASSSGADFTSSSSWRIMLPIRITLAGCSTMSVTDAGCVGSSVRHVLRRWTLDRHSLGRDDVDPAVIGLAPRCPADRSCPRLLAVGY